MLIICPSWKSYILMTICMSECRWYFYLFIYVLLFSRSHRTRGSFPTMSNEFSHWYVFWMKQDTLPKLLGHPVPRSPWSSQLSREQQFCPLVVRDLHRLTLAPPLSQCPQWSLPAGLCWVQAWSHPFLTVNSPKGRGTEAGVGGGENKGEWSLGFQTFSGKNSFQRY